MKFTYKTMILSITSATGQRSTKAARGDRSRKRRLSVESLEGREMMAFQVISPDSSQLLRVVGTSGSDAVDIFVDRSRVRIGNQEFSASRVQAIHVGGRGGSDTINVTYAPNSYNPSISLWGDAGDDKIEIRNAAGKTIAADGGSDFDRLALHGRPSLGNGAQIRFERVWTNAAPQDVAYAFKGRDISDLKRSGELPMDTWPSDYVSCANFVSAILRATGNLSESQHENSVVGLAARLRSLGLREVQFSQARPGDVWIDRAGGRSHTELVFSNSQGAVTLIGSNNVNSDGTQRISLDQNSASNVGSYILSRPW